MSLLEAGSLDAALDSRADEHYTPHVAQSDTLAAEILARRGGEPVDVGALLDAVRADRDERDAQIVGG